MILAALLISIAASPGANAAFATETAETASRSARADAPLERVDLKPLVEYFKDHVSVLERTVHLYHWFNAANADPVWREALSALS